MAPLLREIRDNRLLWLLVFVCRSGDDSLSVAARGVEEQAIITRKIGAFEVEASGRLGGGVRAPGARS